MVQYNKISQQTKKDVEYNFIGGFMKKNKLKVRVMNPPSEERKEEIIRELEKFIQDTYYSYKIVERT